MDFDKRIGNARIKSTKSHVKISYQGETIKLNKRKLKKLFVKIAALVIVLNFVGNSIDDMADKVDYQFDVVSVRVEESKHAEAILAAYNLNIEPNENGNWNNDYSKILSLTKSDIYGFVQYCGYGESEKILRALGYASWSNYLAQEGYYKDGRPDFAAWENNAEYKLVTQRNEAKQNDRSY